MVDCTLVHDPSWALHKQSVMREGVDEMHEPLSGCVGESVCLNAQVNEWMKA